MYINLLQRYYCTVVLMFDNIMRKVQESVTIFILLVKLCRRHLTITMNYVAYEGIQATISIFKGSVGYLPVINIRIHTTTAKLHLTSCQNFPNYKFYQTEIVWLCNIRPCHFLFGHFGETKLDKPDYISNLSMSNGILMVMVIYSSRFL